MNWFSTHTRKWLGFIILFALAYAGLQILAQYSFLRLHVDNSHSTFFKAYWTTASEPAWSERNTATIYVNSHKRNYILPLPVELNKIKQLRLDPSVHKGIKTVISDISLHHISSDTIKFNDARSFKRLKPNDDIKALKVGTDLAFKSGGGDPFFTLDMSPLISPNQPLLLFAQSFLLALFTYFLLAQAGWLVCRLRWVVIALLIAACSALSMATLTAYDKHPDELTHVTNAKYYVDHITPPEACAEDALQTYTIYGVSRLDNREIAYYVGGRYLALVAFIPAPDHVKLRYLNVAMLFFLAFLAFKRSRARILFLPLLLTPQAWYLFSYYNSDALSLFSVFLAAYQLFVPQSMLRRLLNGERPPGYLLWIPVLALLVALQYWVKLNYMLYPIFLFMLVVSWWLIHRRRPNMVAFGPVAMSVLLGTSLFLSWEVSRHAVNDFSLNEKAFNCRELTASPLFKPSTPLQKTPVDFRLRDKGVSLIEMLTQKKWAERIFYTGLGAYGYTEYLNSYTHYELMSALILLLFLTAILMIVFKGGAMTRLSVLSMLAAMFGITLAAALNNWDQDFQPQGRYLMVYLPLFGSILAMYQRYLNLTLLSGLSWGPFVLSLYSFYAIALVEIEKV